MNVLWAGSPESYASTVEARRKLEARMSSDPALAREAAPVPYQRVGSVGVVGIRGSLVSGSAGWMQMYGVVGYADIAAGVIAALQDPEAKSIMYSINSPGGAVDGIDTALDLIRMAKNSKPSSVFTEGMASAALWIGSAAGHITASRFATVGSVGAVAVARNMAKLYEDMGIKHDVIRSDPDKMAYTVYEELSDEARAQIEAQVKTARDMFVADLAINYSIKESVITATFGAGLTFMAEEAMSRKMIHAVGDINAALAKSQRLGAAKKK